MFEIFLVAQVGVVSAEVLIWVIGSILLLSFVALFFYQRLVGKELTLELTQLEKVQKHNIEYEFVLKAMKLCTWHIDAEARTITYDNDFRGKDDSVVLPPDTPIDALSNYVFPSDVAHLSKSIEELCQCHVEELHEVYRVHLPHTNKSYWSESYAAVASRNDEGKAKRIVGTSMRVDDRKAMEGALVEARNKAEESDRLKSAFIANMSHEIRTPLNAIIGFTSVLPDVQGDDERRELINLIQENNQKLLTIINDVMNISKIESGKEQLVMTTFELNALLQSLADMFLPKLASGVELSTQFARNSIDVTTDLNRMTEVINHLLSNAVKFTMQGTITVGYDEPAGKRLRIWIRDTGKGIAPEHLERIFERFFKVDEYIPGAGLGLSICRTMAYSMGGDVGVESTLGEGSLFWFEFPF
jgi:signal transduction histidine kinase